MVYGVGILLCCYRLPWPYCPRISVSGRIKIIVLVYCLVYCVCGSYFGRGVLEVLQFVVGVCVLC
jgi:hypothetical protein